MKNKITFISAQPDNAYFHWQIEVMIHNFMKAGINPNWIEVIFAYDEKVSEEGRKLANRYPYVRFFFYKKTKMETHGYIPILRPDVLSKHFKLYPNLSKEPIFYHDSDIIFRELPDFDSLTVDDIWYVSDTVSYIGSNYIKSKSEEILDDMCRIANIDKSLVELNNENSGGSQYLMKGIDYTFWDEVMSTTLQLYKYMVDREKEERKRLTENELKSYNPIQKWCADMWGVLWVGLKRAEIRISKELNFSWGSSSSTEWVKSKIYHNAGVTSNKEGTVFHKSEYISKSPWDVDFSRISESSNSYNYVQAIMYANEKRKSLIAETLTLV
jgi:hypothetical protein